MKKINIIILMLLICYVSIYGKIIKVSSLTELTAAIQKAVAGDTIIVTNGIYTTSGTIGISCAGTPSNPILITAESIGGVEIKGTGGISLNSGATYVIIRGFKFTHNTGTTKINVGATHCVFTRNIFECAAAGTGNKPYLSISGDDNEISYNTFQNKKTEGPMITVQGPGSSEMAKRTWIHHNYFYNFENSGYNNSSAIQIGLSGRSLSSAYSIVEYNLFINTKGENEGIICNKSCNNIYRYNTFGEGCTEVSLRHGNFCEVYNNFFIGCTGLRFCGDDHKIYNNYFVGCEYAINCVNGDGIVPPDGTDPLTRHDRPDRVKIYNNTLINNIVNFGMPSRTNGLGATDIKFANNIIYGGAQISISTPYINPVWEGNILWAMSGGVGQIPEYGYQYIDPQLERDVYGIYHIKSTSPAINASVGNYPEVSIDIDGQSRIGIPDVGADEFSEEPIIFKPITLDDVGAFQGLTLSLPSAPSNLVAMAVSSRRIDLSWVDNSDNEDRFRIDRSSDGGVTWYFLTYVDANVTTYSNIGLDKATEYCYQVRAENSYGYSEYSNIAKATTLEVGEENLALNKPVTFSSQQMDIGNENPASNAVDGDINTRWSASTFPQWIEVDLGNVMVINKTEVVCYNDRAYQFTIDVKTSQYGEYKRVVDRSNNKTPGSVSSPIIDLFDTTSARFVKLTVTGCYNNTTTWVSILEFRIFYSNEILSLKETINEPINYELLNYPNPFNAETNIFFVIQKKSLIDISIFDLLGKKIITLIHEVKNEGGYIINFNSSGLPSGIYFCRLQSNNVILNRKLLLLK